MQRIASHRIASHRLEGWELGRGSRGDQDRGYGVVDCGKRPRTTDFRSGEESLLLLLLMMMMMMMRLVDWLMSEGCRSFGKEVVVVVLQGKAGDFETSDVLGVSCERDDHEHYVTIALIRDRCVSLRADVGL